ncbi:hypothetical protein LCGC14_1037740 [marine sediment metagenome]|uniref:Uncharacterized protein n=1 Tax=marine sediment metagenome TaxID=412755 RepID=A0A0F9QB15_9ZZZZ
MKADPIIGECDICDKEFTVIDSLGSRFKNDWITDEGLCDKCFSNICSNCCREAEDGERICNNCLSLTQIKKSKQCKQKMLT